MDSYDATVDPQHHLFTFLVSMRFPWPYQILNFPHVPKGESPSSLDNSHQLCSSKSSFSLQLYPRKVDCECSPSFHFHVSSKHEISHPSWRRWGVGGCRSCLLNKVKNGSLLWNLRNTGFLKDWALLMRLRNFLWAKMTGIESLR